MPNDKDPLLNEVESLVGEPEGGEKEFKAGDVVQVRGEAEPVRITGFLLNASGGKAFALTENMTTLKKRDVAIEDVLHKIEGASNQPNEHLIAGNIIAQAANDEIEKWKDKNAQN